MSKNEGGLKKLKTVLSNSQKGKLDLSPTTALS